MQLYTLIQQQIYGLCHQIKIYYRLYFVSSILFLPASLWKGNAFVSVAESQRFNTRLNRTVLPIARYCAATFLQKELCCLWT